MPRGGHRNGRPGATYKNRSDLTAAPRPLPVTTAPNQPYGAVTQQRAAQQMVPMASGPLAAPPAPAPPAAAAPSPVAPGGFGAFDRPSERPSEPVTTGLPSGPGAGPEVLGMGGPTLGRPLSAIIGDAASASGSAELAQLAQRARNLGQ